MDIGIADVRSVKEGQQEEHEERREDVEVTFPEKPLLRNRIDVGPSSVVDGFDLLVRVAGGFFFDSHGASCREKRLE